MPQLSVRGYLSALPAAIERTRRELSYRAYVTDTCKVFLEAINALAQSHEDIPRWVDRLGLGLQVPEETRSPEEVVDGIKAKLTALSNNSSM